MCDKLLFVGPTPVCRSVTGCNLPWPCPARRAPQHGCDLHPFRSPTDYSTPEGDRLRYSKPTPALVWFFRKLTGSQGGSCSS